MASLLRMPGRAAPPRSPEREALAAAIERHAHAVRNLDATTRAIDDASTVTTAANQLAAVAAEAVETAKQNAVTHVTARMMGEVNEAPISVRDARELLQSADDDATTARDVEAGLRSSLKAREEEVYWAKRKLTDAIRAVVVSEPGIRSLIRKFKELQDDLEARRGDLRWLDSQFLIPDDLRFWEAAEMHVEPLRGSLPEGAAPWAAALEELASNSEAPLPIT